MIPSALVLVLIAAIGCSSDDEEIVPETTVEYLSSTEHLVRASMALRGARPSVDELREVADDPEALPGIIDEYLDSPEFGETIRDLHNDQLLVRTDLFFFNSVGFLAEGGFTATEVNESVFSAPLRLIEHVVMNDRPYTEIVTADYTVANSISAGVWGLSYDESGPEWQETRWTDGRPQAGILSSSALFTRHQSAGFNYNRGRANLLANALLCYDFLERDAGIDSSVNLADPEIVTQAVTEVAQCAGCHQTLDPMASYLWGYEPLIVPQLTQSYPILHYTADNETRWQRTTFRPPGFFGDQGGQIDGLGQKIADDPRFAQCAAQRFYAYMAQVERESVPFDVILDLQQSFEDSEFDAKALAKAVVLHDAFRVSHSSDEVEADDVAGFKKARPEQLARMMYDLTGFRWETEALFDISGAPLGRVELAKTDLLGFRTLAGGIDSYFTTTPARTVTVTSSLFLAAFAAEAAGHVVETELGANPGTRRLLTRVGPDDVNESGIRAQLVDLHLRLYGEDAAADSEDVSATYDLFAAVHRRTGDVRHAWKTTLTAMLQDLKVAYY